MTKKQPTMPIIDRVELYKALYVPLDGDKKKDLIRTKTLKTLLGVKNIESLKKTLKDYNEVQKALKSLEKVDAEETSITKLKNIPGYWDAIKLYWDAIHDLYVCYLKALKAKQGKTPINKILIYEAPRPPKIDGQINYILAESYKNCTKSEDYTDKFPDTPSGPYVDTIKGLVENPITKTIEQILVKQGILFIDLCPLPLPMTTDIRRDVWGETFDEKDEKPLSVVLLELALKFAIEKGVKISETPTIAMGTPSATSQSIYLYFERKKWSGSSFKNPNIIEIENNVIDFTDLLKTNVIDFTELLKTNKTYVEKGQILPLYASNIISGSNTPNAELLKRIF